jgi:hypothetical protein
VPVKASAAAEIEIDRASTQKVAKDTKTYQELGSCHDPALPKEWGPRNTRKDAKGDERCRLGGPCHIARPDIGQGTRSCAIRRGISKKRATAIFDLSPRVGPPSLCVLLCKFSLLSSVRARFRSGGLHREVIMRMPPLLRQQSLHVEPVSEAFDPMVGRQMLLAHAETMAAL